jgi:glucose/arabinose dehydrogenase
MHRSIPLLSILVVAAAACGGEPAAAPNLPEQKLGAHFDIQPAQLPKPYATRSAGNPPEEIRRPNGAMPQVPKGFRVNVFADGLAHARWLAVAPNGDVFLAESNSGEITLLRDANNDGVSDRSFTYADDMERPHGLAFHGGFLYVGDTRTIWRIAYKNGDTRAAARQPVMPPGSLGSEGGHWTRNIAIDSKGRIFVAVGSMGNVAEEPKPHAAISMVQAGKLVTFASGLRNPVGIAFYPGTDNLWTTVNERDGLGDGLVPDYMTRVEQGAFYGWPYAYVGKNPDPEFGKRNPAMVARTRAPDVLFQAHAAALGLVFYNGAQFPAAYRGGAFVAFHGSWNSNRPSGYKVVFVPFKGGKPAGGYDNFAVGFWQSGTSRAQVWGRPVGLAIAKDGSLLIADDVANVIWRVSWKG